MSNKSMKHIQSALELAEEMIRMVDREENTCDDDGCLVVHGVIKDCAYKIKGAAERELHGMKDREWFYYYKCKINGDPFDPSSHRFPPPSLLTLKAFLPYTLLIKTVFKQLNITLT